MSDNTKIEWADATANAINGCSVHSPGCTNCYAMRLAGTRLRHHPTRIGLTDDSKAGPVWNGNVRFEEKVLGQVLSWRRPRRIFWNAHGDMFHENVPTLWIDRILAVCALTPHHTHMILTKRAERMRDYMQDRARHLARFMIDEYLIKAPDSAPKGRAINAAWPVTSIGDIDAPDDVTMRQWPLPNVWLGVSVEDQRRAHERIPHLLHTPAAVRFLSCEPLLAPIDLSYIEVARSALPAWCTVDDNWAVNALTGRLAPIIENGPSDRMLDGGGEKWALIDWVIVGGESGPNARPMHPDWVRNLRDQCAEAGVAFHFKQWGESRPYIPEIDDFTRDDPTGEYGDSRSRHFLNEGEVPGPHNILVRVGKAKAGRMLDGVTHDAFPSNQPTGGA